MPYLQPEQVKCDRKIPCAACVKRGAPETCQWQWNDNQIDPLILFSKLNGDIEDLQARLKQVEAYIKNTPGHVAAQTPSSNAALSVPKASSVPPEASLSLDSSKKNETNDGDMDIVAPSAGNRNTQPASASVYTPPTAGPSTASAKVADDSLPHPPTSRANSGPQEAEYDAAAENAAIYLESFANQGARAEDSQTPVSPQHLLDTAVMNHNISWQDMELTEALTSIRDLPTKLQSGDTHLTWFPHSNDGLSYTSARTKALQEVYTYLPTAAQIEYLIQLFEEKVNWRFSIVHLPALRLELKRLWEMFAAGRQMEVDPLWLGVLFMVLALGMNNHPTTPAPGNAFPGLTTEQISALATGYHSASLKSLHIGDCMGKPRPRTVQWVCLLNTVVIRC